MPFTLQGISELCLLFAVFAMHVPLFLQGKDHMIPSSLRHSAAQTSERCNVAEGDAEQAVWAQTLPSLRDHVHLVVREYMGQKVCDRTKSAALN